MCVGGGWCGCGVLLGCVGVVVGPQLGVGGVGVDMLFGNVSCGHDMFLAGHRLKVIVILPKAFQS